MLISDFIAPERILLNNQAQSKKAVLLAVSALLSTFNTRLKPAELFNAFWERENLGSTALGHGVSLPHIRVSQVETICGCFIKLKHPVDFGATDKLPADLIIGLIVPQNHCSQHLSALSELMTLFSDDEFRQDLREADSASELYTLLTKSQTLVTTVED